MAHFGNLTGRRYSLFDYIGHPEAERVVVLMGSGAECAHEVVEHLVARGERVGVIKVRLFRPFSVEHLLQCLPVSVQAVAVLDRTKEPGASGEPLMQELVTGLVTAVQDGRLARLPRIIGGRYGLAGKGVHAGDGQGGVRRTGPRAPPRALHGRHSRRCFALVAGLGHRLRP